MLYAWLRFLFILCPVFHFIVSVAMLIVATLNFTHKKIAVLCTLASLGQLFFINNAISPGRVITFTFRLPIFLLYLSYRRL